MLADSDIIAFVSTTDMVRARAFYAAALGLTVVEETPYALVLDAHGTMLRVTAVDALTPAGYTVLGWRVDDAGAVMRRLAAAGVPAARFEGMAQDADGVWTTPGGDRVGWFRDPDGNMLSVTEFAARR